jgi:hypothetical protein
MSGSLPKGGLKQPNWLWVESIRSVADVGEEHLRMAYGLDQQPCDSHETRFVHLAAVFATLLAC